MSAAILCIGTELTRGELVNTNATWLARELTERGCEVLALEVVDDEPSRIIATCQRLAQTHELLVCTGGLGPTTDDRTTASLAEAARVKMVLHGPSLSAIRERLAARGIELGPSNAKQAYFPEGASILPNPLGTAPGFRLTLGRACVYCLPGVPSEMKGMFEQCVVPDLLGAAGDAPVQILLCTFGLPEATVNDMLAGIETDFDVVLGYRAHFPEIQVKVMARAANPQAAQAKAERAAAVVRQRLGDAVYAQGDRRLPDLVGSALLARKWTLGVVESCTGGRVAAELTSIPGASAWFLGGLVTYANSAKLGLLDVPEPVLAQHGAVSPEVAMAMANGGRRALGCDVGLAITGIAGPSGGTPDKPVGTVHWAVTTPQASRHECRVFRWDRERVQKAAAHYGMILLLRNLNPAGPA